MSLDNNTGSYPLDLYKTPVGDLLKSYRIEFGEENDLAKKLKEEIEKEGLVEDREIQKNFPFTLDKAIRELEEIIAQVNKNLETEDKAETIPQLTTGKEEKEIDFSPLIEIENKLLLIQKKDLKSRDEIIDSINELLAKIEGKNEYKSIKIKLQNILEIIEIDLVDSSIYETLLSFDRISANKLAEIEKGLKKGLKEKDKDLFIHSIKEVLTLLEELIADIYGEEKESVPFVRGNPKKIKKELLLKKKEFEKESLELLVEIFFPHEQNKLIPFIKKVFFLESSFGKALLGNILMGEENNLGEILQKENEEREKVKKGYDFIVYSILSLTE